MQKLIQNDMLGSVEANLKVGNITEDDANQLLTLTNQLYEYLYEEAFEKVGCQDMKPLLEGALELPIDKYLIEIDELKADKEKLEAKLEDEAAKAKAEKEAAEIKSDAQIEKLRQRIRELEQR